VSSSTCVSGSKRKPLKGARKVGDIPHGEQVDITVVLQPRTPFPAGIPERMSRHEFVQRYGATRKDIELVREFARTHHLKVVEPVSMARRSVVLTGTALRMQRAFETKLARFRSVDGEYRGRTGELCIRGPLGERVQAVLGLDDRPQGSPNWVEHPHADSAATATGSMLPHQLRDVYEFPSRLTGRGQKIAVIELGGGFVPAMLQNYFEGLGLKMPKITCIGVDGARNRPGVKHRHDGEVILDLEAIGALAPDAEMLVYFAPTSDRGFVDAVTTAVFDPRAPSVISISWGQPENEYTEQARLVLDQAFQAAAALGITVCAASGDSGWTDSSTGTTAHVDYPASSPYVLACGGTTLMMARDLFEEVVWNHNGSATGGGVSLAYDMPEWQKGHRIPRAHTKTTHGRGVPDVAGAADPRTCLLVGWGDYLKPVGGTSAVAPLWAALIACLNQRLRKPVGFLTPRLYDPEFKAVFNDVVRGGNGHFRARRGWDACTGHGTPNGKALLKALLR
jgi:kumamolisin